MIMRRPIWALRTHPIPKERLRYQPHLQTAEHDADKEFIILHHVAKFFNLIAYLVKHGPAVDRDRITETTLEETDVWSGAKRDPPT